MSKPRKRCGDDGNTRVAAYESMLDLFTVISFMLILAASLQVARSTGPQSSSSVMSEVARPGGGVQPALPKDVVLVVLYRENLTNRLSVVFGGTANSFNEAVTEADIEATLSRVTLPFTPSTKINIGLDEERGQVNPAIWMKMQRWLTKNGHGRYNVYYVDQP